MFEKLPVTDDKLPFDDDGMPILPARHDENEFDEAAIIVREFEEKYQSYGCIDPTQIDGDAYQYIWQLIVEGETRYIRPDILVAAVHYVVEEIIRDVLNDPWFAIQNHYNGETELDKKIEAVAKRVAEQEVK